VRPLTGAPGDLWQVPELGPSLGRMSDPPLEGQAGPLNARLDDIRLRLVTDVFDLAGAGRGFVAAGDPGGAVASLNRVAWLTVWEKAVASAAERLSSAITARFKDAAAESRYPRKRLRAAFPTAGDTRAIAARLGAGGGPFVAALDELEQAAHRVTGHRGDVVADSAAAWQSALAATARRLEAAWIALEEAALAEQRLWHAEIERVRRWRLPRWPLWLLTLSILGGAAYLGLVLGGYVPVPPPLAGFAEFWWNRL
jgi:hypothetical protein